MQPQVRRHGKKKTYVMEPMDVPMTAAGAPDGAILQLEDGRLGVFVRGVMPAAVGVVMIDETTGHALHPDDRVRYVAWPGYATLLLLAAARGERLDLSALAALEREGRDGTAPA